MLIQSISLALLYKAVPSVIGIMHKFSLFPTPCQTSLTLELADLATLASEKLPLPLQSTASWVDRFARIRARIKILQLICLWLFVSENDMVVF